MKKLVNLMIISFVLLGLTSCRKWVLEYKIEKTAQEINLNAINLSKDKISEEEYVKNTDSLVIIYNSLCYNYNSFCPNHKYTRYKIDSTEIK